MNIDRPYRMYCLTNDMNAKVSAKKIELVNNWSGWWSKVELFRPDLPCGRTLYLDLDTTIIKNVYPLFEFKNDLVMFPSPYKGKTEKETPDGKQVIKYQAAIMLFDPGKLSWLYFKFRDNANYYMQKYRSEQDIYGEWLPNQPTFPSEWIMKLGTVRKGKPVGDKTMIVTGNKNGKLFRDIEV